MSGKEPLPPYFSIDPARAAKRLSEPIGTARFAKAAAFAAFLRLFSGVMLDLTPSSAGMG